MSQSRAHILKPLTDQSGLITFFMDKQNAKGICKMRLLMAADALAACHDHNKWFCIHTNASDFQLGMCIIQEGRPVAYFSCKLTMSQQNNTTLKKNTFHHSYSQRMLRYAPQRTFMFLGNIKT
jgi:hypothetical protein